MSNLTELLVANGLTFSQVKDYIYKNLNNPNQMYNAFIEYGFTYQMIANIYGQGVTENDVKVYFDSFGLDASSTRHSTHHIDQSLLSLLQEKSFEVALVSDLASRNTAFVESLICIEQWHGDSITFAFPSSMPTDYLEYDYTSINWRPLTVKEQNAFTQLASTLNQYIAVDIIKGKGTGDIQVSAVEQVGCEAFAYYPGDGLGGDIFLKNINDLQYYSKGGYGSFTMVHELGHALGLEHTFSGNVLSEEFDNSYFSAMSYTIIGGFEVEILNFGATYYAYANGSYRSELGILDVAALQAMYGADLSVNVEDTVYIYNESSRSFTDASGYYHTIWDAGGVDTLDLSDATYGSIVNLNDYTLSSVSKRTAYEEAVEIARKSGRDSSSDIVFIQSYIEDLGESAFLNINNLGIAYGTVIENVITGDNDDVVTDNEVDNQIFTGKGNDTIYLGKGGYDFLDGGEGVDTVVLNIRQDEVEQYIDNNGYHLLSGNFAVTLVGIESVQYLDVTESLV